MPESAAAVLGDFCFLAGKPDRELAVHDFDRDFLIMVPQNEAWSEVIEEVWGERAFRRMRYAIKKDSSCFNREILLEYVKKLPEPYQLHPIDKELYRQCREQDWSRDLVALFSTFEMYEQLGLGMAVTKDSIPVGTRRTSGQSHWQKNSDTPGPMTTRCMKQKGTDQAYVIL